MAERRARQSPQPPCAGAGGAQIEDLLHNLRFVGIDADSVCRAVGLDGTALAGAARVPWPTVHRLLATAQEIAGDPLLGLHAAEPGSRDLLSYLVATQPTVERALAELARFLKVSLDDVCIAIESRSADAVVVFDAWPGATGTARHLLEYLAGVIVADLTRFSGGRFRPAEVTFPHTRGGATAEYERVLRCRVRFEQPRFTITITNPTLATPLDTRSSEVAAVMRAAAERQLDLAAAVPAGRRVAAALRVALARGDRATPSTVAKSLAMSPRTLQRRLENEGTSFRALRDEARRERALQRLTEPAVTIAVVADEMGFTDSSAFHKAFRRWTGTSPNGYRRSVLSRR
ncbi:MAG: hypothetical protein B6D46_16540 [Polyangiaceae bacterium UTPRO1]|nr:AraC family transcriptional regulator ligand-binding domain-containing protein [Myxococcales bacterium]OQY64559.1 MAG: hypothetical protein B6D46_16540 [Polyangiaceae bacterium UTPRO1]